MRDFAPGVRIDWAERAIELDAKVVLREGALELLACSPQTREHESVFVVGARPLHIHQALGLIGLQHGRPIRYDEESDRWFAPYGEPLSITVSCATGPDESPTGPGSAMSEPRPASDFLRLPEKDRSPASVDWVWAGSRVLPDGRFGADLDGTVICVVDFDTALITVGALHTSDNEALWLEANTDVIPPVNSPCTIRVARRSSDKREKPSKAVQSTEVAERDQAGVSVAILSKSDSIRFDNATFTIDEFVNHFAGGDTGSPRPPLRLRVSPSVSRESVDKAVGRLREAGINRITIESMSQDNKSNKPPDEHD